ncbi:MAG: PP2C family serine/threonine-protein phosphatase [Thermaerobacter sp.]|nr:PP2C family serine/threonine-protein phosphatase [Thermaerobacter sp.]
MIPRCAGVCVRGPSHVKRRMPCQDDFTWRRLSEGGVVLAVADGAGSARRAEWGARAAVRLAVQGAQGRWTAEGREGLTQATQAGMRLARVGLEQLAEKLQIPLRDLACTLMVTVWRLGEVAVAHVGDGAVVGWSVDGTSGYSWRLVSAPENAEYVNETRFVTDADWPIGVQLSTGEGLAGVVVFTDGCQRAALRREENSLTPFPGFLTPLARYAAQAGERQQVVADLRKLLNSEKLRETSDDDKTLVLLWDGGED